MKAITFQAQATHFGAARTGTIMISIDALGPKMEFLFDDKNFEDIVFTSDDAYFISEIVGTRFGNISEEWKKANEGEWLFEAGAWIAYEGFFNEKLFRNYADAVAHATKVAADADGYMTPEIHARMIES
jgi:hypothetical protein